MKAETLSVPGASADYILDMLAKRAIDDKPLPARVTHAGEEMPTADFLKTFAYDRRLAVAPLVHLTSGVVMNPQVNECVAALREKLETKPTHVNDGIDHELAEAMARH